MESLEELVDNLDEPFSDTLLKLIDENKLAGASFWKLGFETSSIWDTIIKYIN